MKSIVVMVLVLFVTCASARENVDWAKFLGALAEVESTNGLYMRNKTSGAWGWYQMRRLARKDANDYLGTSYRGFHLVSRPVANRMFMAYVHKYRSKWSTMEDLVHLWHLGPSWRDRLYKDYGYLKKFQAAYRKR